MIICKKCNTQLEDGTRFCYVCGTEVTAVWSCPGCGKPVDSKASFCESCGTAIHANGTIPPQTPVETPASNRPMNQAQGSMPASTPDQGPIQVSMQGPVPMPSPTPMSGSVPMPGPMPMPGSSAMSNFMPIQPGSGKQIKPARHGKLLLKILIAVAAVAVVVVIAVLVPRLLKSAGSVNAALYLKDSEINYTSLSSVKPKEITDALDDNGTISTGYGDYLSYEIALSSDGKRLFYPDRIVNSEEGMTLYYQKVNSKNSEGEKIDSEISSYIINDAGTKIFYIKGSENTLYISNLESKEKLDSDVSTFYVNSSGSKVIYINNAGNIYEKEGKKDVVKIDSNSSIVSVSEDLDTIYYLKNNSLYVKKSGKDKEKLLSEVSSVINIYETGEIYYLKSSDIIYNLSDFLNDDLASSDAAMAEPTEPLYPDYNNFSPNIDYPKEPDYYSYTDEWGYIDWDAYDAAYNEYYAAVDEYNALWDKNYNAAMAAYNQAYDVYLGACDEYYAKQNRDSIRSSITGVTIPVTNSILYYYDTKDSTKVSDTYSSYYDYSTKKPVLVYTSNKVAEISKVNMSELTSYDDLYSRATGSIYTTAEVYTAVKAEASDMKREKASSFYVNVSGDTIYFMDNYNSDMSSGDLYEIKITDNKLGSPSKIDNNVYSFEKLYGGDNTVYYKDVKDSSGDLYYNKKLVDSDVYTYSAYQIEGTDSITYYTDYNSVKQLGTLKIYNGKEPKKISDDIHSYSAINENRILYLMDYSVDRAKGDLYLYNGTDKKKEIDTDVTALIPIYENGYRGDYSYLWEY